MKRYGNLWPHITDFHNLILSARQAQRGKRFRDNVLEFNYCLEQSLHQLQQSLFDKSYRPGKYKTFAIYDPKPRLISAAPYRDRVVHHALCNVIMPIFDRGFIPDSYANRLGFGTHRALKRFTQFAASYRYVLQCDLQKYFPSIDHEILKVELRQRIKCPDTLWLIDLIIDGSNEQEPVLHYFPGDDLLTPLLRRHGLPIGNLTSQFFANVYLNRFDHFAKETLKLRAYLRYVDDFAAFGNDRAQLAEARVAMEEYLRSLRLKMHPIKSQLFETQCGANFVGFRVLPTGAAFPRKMRIRVRNDNLRRARIRLRLLRQGYAEGTIAREKLTQRLQSWNAHLLHGHTYRLRRQIFDAYGFAEFLAI